MRDTQENPFKCGMIREAFQLAKRERGVSLTELAKLAASYGGSYVVLLRCLRTGSTKNKKYHWRVMERDGWLCVIYPIPVKGA